MRAIHIQRLLALIFIVLGGWALFFPAAVESLVLRPEYRIGNSTSALLIGCFGAQAMLTGTVILKSRFLPSTFLVFGLLASVPFFVFNYYFYFIRGMFTSWMLLDFVGNVGIFICGVAGYRLSRKEHAARHSSQRLPAGATELDR